eukprot:scaffold204683_cov28-Prasinocladus_malaysianus.AAC.1
MGFGLSLAVSGFADRPGGSLLPAPAHPRRPLVVALPVRVAPGWLVAEKASPPRGHDTHPLRGECPFLLQCFCGGLEATYIR